MTTIEKTGSRVYLVNLPFSAKDAAKSEIGAKWDSDRKQWWVGVAKTKAAEEFAAKINTPSAAGEVAKEDTDAKRVYAKVNHDGRSYFVIGQTTDNAGQPLRVRLIAFAADSVPFWIDAAKCELVKEYPGRKVWDGRRGNGTVTKYTTLGGIRDFVAGQKEAEAKGIPQCAACHKRSSHLIEDLEDGLMKCAACCDMPSE